MSRPACFEPPARPLRASAGHNDVGRERNSSAVYVRMRVVSPAPSGCRPADCGRSSTRLLQSLHERDERSCDSGSSAAVLMSTPMRRIRSALLRARRERPRRRRAAEQRDELAPSHSITSSARARSVGGIVEAERLGGREIDHELEFCRLLDRKIGRLRCP